MKYDIKALAAERLREHKKNRLWLIAFLCLAAMVVLATVTALKLYGQAMTHQVKVLECGYEVHEHTKECYKEGDEKELICIYADYVVHVHNDDCRDSNGNLVCPLDEVEVHEHEESCWQEEQILICGEEEAVEAQPEESGNQEPVQGDLICGKEEHAHSDACYSQTLTCETEEHTHGEDCVDAEGNLICEVEEHGHGEDCYSQELICEVEEHIHEDACYEWITPETEESQAEGHVHTDACYVTERVLSCGKLELHTHTDECYAEESFDEAGNLIEGSLPVCGLLQLEEHVHGEGCFEIVELTAEEVAALNAGATLHIHEESCYDEENNLICGHEVTHLHGLECYDEAGKLICEFAESHVHSAECYDEAGNLICEQEEIKEHEHDASCYDTEGNLICGNEDAVDHVHGEGCVDEEGNLVCGHEVHEVFEQVQTYEAADHSYIVTARYNQDAELPENAQFRADMITPEMDSEHYAKREAEYREEIGNEDASMRALLKIGFYVDGEEVEPKAPVSITIQFLDEEGLEEGAPITVVHFAEGGTETLDGSHAKDDSTTFKMNGFSEIAIGYGTEEPREVEDKEDGTRRIQIDDTFEYEDDAFHITFFIKGEAILPEGVILDTEKEDKDAVQNTVPAGEEGQPDEEGSAETDAEAGSSGTEEDDDASDTEAQTEEPVEGETPESMEEPGEEDTFAEEEGEAPKAPQENSTKKSGWEPKLQLKVELLGRDSEEYQAFAEDFIKSNNAAELFRMQVMKYTLTYEGVELDISECKVTAQVRMTKSFKERVEESIPEAAAFLMDSDNASEENAEEAGLENGQLSADETEASEPEEEIPVGEGASASAGSYIVVCSQDGLPDDEATADEEPVDSANEELGDDTGEAAEGKDTPADTESTPEATEPQQTAPEDGMDATAAESVKEITIEAGAVKDDGTVNNLDSVVFDGDAAVDEEIFTISLDGVSVFGMRASGQPNPKFTVQYYANLDVLATTGTNPVTMIDTSGRVLPTNKGNTTTLPTGKNKNMYVDANGNVQTVKQLTKVYTSRNFEYHKAPTINYMNSLVENTNYELKEVWVLKSGKKADSTDKADWDVHTYNEELHFTNREVSAESGKYILIKDNAVIRFVYDTTTMDKDFAAAFYDYDISNGLIFRTATPADYSGYNRKNAGDVFSGDTIKSDFLTWAEGNSAWDGHIYTYTKATGINSSGNYSGNGTKLAFGNVNTGTTLGKLTWSNNELNKYNNKGYQGCTFGLVTGMSDGKIQYASGVTAPKLFNEGDATGKSAYDKGEYSLKFNRVGDTYTLSAVNGTGTANLGKFTNPKNSQGNYDGKHGNGIIWTNNFWPMDSAPSFGTGTHDVKFGASEYFKGKTHELRFGPSTERGTDYTFPESDDGLNHNSYFGMHYEVEFDLVKDYVGPLEYYFFGDDDMWVFLDGNLVCDIGGVHSSVGEYVNLWDYLEKGSEGTHKLSFFYTERGASGSTCWMQFTLPSVSSLTPETTDKDYGKLKVEKTVTQINNDKVTVVDNGDEFSFTINLTDANGEKLPDDYSYVKYDKNGKEIGSDLIIWDGGEFTLKNGEYIIINYLPQGTKYTITEANQAITVTDNTSENSRVEYFTDITGSGIDIKDLEDNKVAEGAIPKGDTAEVKYNNKFYIYALPETGGSGTNLYTMAGAIIVLFGAGLLYRKKFRERRA